MSEFRAPASVAEGDVPRCVVQTTPLAGNERHELSADRLSSLLLKPELRTQFYHSIMLRLCRMI